MSSQAYTFHTTPYASISPLLPALSTAGRTVLITGGGSGIGPAIVQAFATSGSTQLSILGRTASSLLATKARIEAQFPQARVLTFVADITNALAVNIAFEETKKAFGPIDIFVSNAGYMPDTSLVSESNVEDYMQGLESNVKGPLLLTQAFLRNLDLSRKPVLLGITTAGAHLPAVGPGMSAYVVSKLAGLKMMEYVALENPGVRVMNMHPGTLDTDMYQKCVRAGLAFPIDDGLYSALPNPPSSLGGCQGGKC
jgi:NAD(P)-dependent dehydrogenase (short-subunit alcohol dehydrogenase family)